MLYDSAEAWRNADRKRIMLFGMSGLGKTHISALLRETGDWFHYSVDYRIGTRYMGEHIADNFKREAMKVPLLRELLMTDSVYIASNITFDNLSPLSTYLGKPGDPAKGGLPWDEYCHRQTQHRAAEVAAMLDSGHFAARAEDLYGYSNFVCDSSGSVCEVVDPWDDADPVMTALSKVVLPVWIEGNDAHTAELVRRFDRAPKPMCYNEAFLADAWEAYCAETGLAEEDIDPDAFVRWTYARALAHRQPRYAEMARRWGVTLAADDVARVTIEADMIELVAGALEARG
ncbi:ATPase [Alphaproteobacteria bacterium GH1-50]|uniref:ATPase n=1 Tax=Kangsaoukella pontilimi TaxID=2691042 RepID=A0A7C9J1V0_9RHOB|nr:ATPase [Kangsaoukella pontilimi]MXQ07101.1 ATPase [Kangsaoukella pontilimi]